MRLNVFLMIYLTIGGRLIIAFCRGGWGERSCPRSATAIHSVAMDRTLHLPIERRTLYHRTNRRPRVNVQWKHESKWWRCLFDVQERV